MRNILVLLSIASFFVFYGCSKPAAVVNGEEISMKTYRMALDENKQQHALPGKEVNESQLKDAVIQQLIGERLLVQAAKEKNVTVSDEEVSGEYDRMVTAIGRSEFEKRLKEKGISAEGFRARLKDQILARKFVDSLVPEDKVTEEDMKEFYKGTPKMFIHPLRVFVRLIQTSTEDEAKSIMAELENKGADFDAIADRLMKGKKAVVTDYGWTEPGFYSPDIAEALKEIKKGGFGGPFKGKEGFYILRVKDKKAETPMSFEEAKAQIKNMILSERRQAAVSHLITERKKKATIKINI